MIVAKTNPDLMTLVFITPTHSHSFLSQVTDRNDDNQMRRDERDRSENSLAPKPQSTRVEEPTLLCNHVVFASVPLSDLRSLSGIGPVFAPDMRKIVVALGQERGTRDSSKPDMA